MKLYHYTTVDAFCKIWVSQKIKFSDSFKTNDLFEQRKGLPAFGKLYTTKKFHSILDAAKAFDKLYSNELSMYKQISFVMDYQDKARNLICEGWQSSMMWGQYSHNQMGVCIEIDSEKLPIDKNRFESDVDYRENMPTLPHEEHVIYTKKFIKEYIQKNIDIIFFVKHNHWENENEYRMIKRGGKEMFLSIANAITNVFVYSVDDISAEIVNNLIPENINLYALWIETKGDVKVIDKVDYRRYKAIMEGKIIPQRCPTVSLLQHI